ncbi:MAG: hypothetical protein EBT92_11150 [Planctomycetes bacterium]|nr:hypothetical protein [Planctomycetota bacterium]
MDIFVLLFLIALFLSPVVLLLWGVKWLFSLSRLPSRFCNACGSELNPASMQCYNCGKNPAPRVSKEVEELRIALEQLEKLVDRDEVSREASAAVVIALQNRLAKIAPISIPPVPVPPIPINPIETSDVSTLISVIEDEGIPPALPVVQSQESKSKLEDERPLLPFPKSSEVPIVEKPKRSLAGVLSLFLESRNILLGELVGGLLIVGGSVALVGTLWNSLEQIPYFPFLMLAAIALLLFFAGQYTLHHWKLQSTSRGMLVISILLAVLSLLVLANLGVAGSGYWIAAAVQVIALTGIAILVKKATSDLFEDIAFVGIPRPLTFGILVFSAAMLLASWFVPLDIKVAQGGAILLALLGACLSRIAKPATSAKVILFALILVFSLCVAQGFLLASAGDFTISLLAIPLIFVGVVFLALQLPGPDASDDAFSLAGPLLYGFGILTISIAPFLAWADVSAMILALWISVAILVFFSRTAVPLYGPLAASMQMIVAFSMQLHLLNGTLDTKAAIASLDLVKILVEPPSAFAMLFVGFIITGLARWNVENSWVRKGWIAGAWIAAMSSLAMGWAQADGPGPGGAIAQIGFAFILLYLYRIESNGFSAIIIAVFPITAVAALLYPDPPANFGFACLGMMAFIYSALARIISSSAKIKSLNQAFNLLSCILIAGLLPAWYSLSKSPEDKSFFFSLGALELGIACILLAWQFGRVELTLGGLLFWSISGYSFFQHHFLFIMPFTAGVLAAATLALLLHVLNSFFVFFDSHWDEGVYAPAQIAEYWLLLLLPLVLVIESSWALLDSKVLDLSLAIYLDWFAFAALLRALLVSSSLWFRTFQVAIAGSVGCLSLHFIRMQPWFLEQGGNLNHPWALQTLGCWISLLAFVWSVLRFEARKSRIFRDIWFETRRSIDEWTLAGLCAILLGLGLFSAFIASTVNWGLLPESDWPNLMMGRGILLWYAILLVTCIIYLWDEASYPKLVLFHLLIGFGATLVGYHLGKENIAFGLNLSWSIWFLIGSILLTSNDSLNAFCNRFTIRVQEGNLPERALRWNIAGFALLTLAWKLAEDLASIMQDSAQIPFQARNYFAPIAVLILGLFVQVFSQRNQRFLFHIQWLVMAAAGVGYIRSLHQAEQLDKGSIVILPQMMALAGGFFLWLWFLLKRFVHFKLADYPSRATLSAGSLAAVAIILGLMRLNGSGKEAHIFTSEAGSILGLVMLGSVLSGCSALRLQEFGALYWRNVLFAGFGILATLACVFERNESYAGMKFLVLAGPIYLFLWVFAYPIRDLFQHRLHRIQFTNLSELAGLLQGLGLFLLFLVAWAAWPLGFTVHAMIGLGFLIATSMLLGWFRNSDRHASIAFWLSSLFGALAVYHQNIGVAFINWYALMIAGILCATSIQTALWSRIKILNHEWLFKSRVSSLEATHILLPWVTLLMLILPTGFQFVLAGNEDLFTNWLHIMSGKAICLAMVFSFIANLYYRVRAGLPLGIICTGSVLNLGIVAGLIEFERGGSFSGALITIGVVWIFYGLAISLLGIGFQSIGKSIPFIDEESWPTNLNFILAASLFVAFRIGGIEAVSPWIVFSLICLIALQMAIIAAWRNLPGYAVANILTSLAACIYLGFAFHLRHLLDMFNLIGLGLGGISFFWLLVSSLPLPGIKPFVNRMTESAMQIALLTTGLGGAIVYFGGLNGQLYFTNLHLAFSSFLILALVSVIGFLSAKVKYGDFGLFILGLTAIAYWLRSRNLIYVELIQATCIPLSLLMTLIAGMSALPLTMIKPLWLPAVQGIVSGIILLLSVWISWHAEIFEERIIGAFATFCVAPSALFLAWAGLGTSRSVRREFLILLASSWCLFLQAVPSPLDDSRWPQRAALLQFGVLMLALVGRLSLGKLIGVWEFATKLIRDRLPILAFLCILCTLVFEAIYFEPQAMKSLQPDWAVKMVLFSIASLGLGCLRFAWLMDEENARDTSWKNTRYTWGILVVLLSLFLHSRLCRPEWFGGFLGQYWSLGALVLSFMAAGLSELFFRRNKQAIALPIMLCGVLIPLAPQLSFWFKQYLIAYPEQFFFMKSLAESVLRLPGDFASHAFLWFLAALVWGWVAMQRNSFFLMLASCLGMVGGFWSLWASQGFSVFQHPQMWLVPPAIFVLILENSLRSKLHKNLSQFLRYTGLAFLYASSASDLLILGIGYSVWLPIALAFWSVMGILAGMASQTKGFLYFGMAFLIMDIFFMIWHAAVDKQQTWVWWISVIVLGGAILAMFTLFEKKKTEIKNLMTKLKSWD